MYWALRFAKGETSNESLDGTRCLLSKHPGRALRRGEAPVCSELAMMTLAWGNSVLVRKW